MTLAATGRAARRLALTSCRRPWLTLAAALVLAVVGVAYAVTTLAFKTDTLDLLPPDAPYVERWRTYERQFGQFEDIVVVVDAPTIATAAAYAERLHQLLAASPVHFPRVTYRADASGLAGRGLLYLPLSELRQLQGLLQDHQRLLKGFAREPDLVRLVEELSRQLAREIAGQVLDLGLNRDDEPFDATFLITLVEQIGERLEGPTPYRSPWSELFALDGAAAPEREYFVSDDGRLLFVLVETPPADTRSFTMDRQAIEALRSATATLRTEFPDVAAGVTGGPALAHDEMTAAFRDSSLAAALAFAMILVVMGATLRGLRQPALVLTALAVSLAWSLGVAALVVGHLTLFSVVFVPLVAGIGIDYGIYLLCRYREELDGGRRAAEALDITATRTGPAIVLSAATAAGTFFVLRFTDFPGIQELGVIAGIAIVLACLAMLTLLPAMLTLAARGAGRTSADAAAPVGMDLTLTDRASRRPRAVLGGAFLVTILACLAIPAVTFDDNLLNLQAKETESVAWQRRMQASLWRGGLSAITTANSLEELEAKEAAFEHLPSVYEVESIRDVVPPDQDEKLRIVRTLAPLVAPARLERTPPVDVERLGRALDEIRRRMAIAAAEAPGNGNGELIGILTRLDRTVERLGRTTPAQARAALGELQGELHQDLIMTLQGLRQELVPRRIDLADVPEDIRRRYVSPDGRLLLLIHPRVDAWERAEAEVFVRELRSVDAEVTGPAIINWEALATMGRAWRQGTIYAYLLVAGLAWLLIRRLRETVFSLLPLVLGFLWTLGIMTVFGLTFTPANIFALPLLVGACAEFGLALVLSHMEQRERGGPLVAPSAATGVFLNGLTTMAGFGSLLVAQHRGIFGLGLLLTIGAAARLVASLVVLPALLRRFPSRTTVSAGHGGAPSSADTKPGPDAAPRVPVDPGTLP